MMKYYFVILFMFTTISVTAQDENKVELPYYEVPEYSKDYTAGTMAARMVDALGFRFYWSSEGLNEKDLAYQPSEGVRSTAETIDHILDLSYVIVNSTLKKPNGKVDKTEMTFEDKRKQALFNLKTAADLLRKSDDISQFKIIFGENEIPFWNLVNGPIADAIWHCGQLASFRRNSGNPINPNVNHFSGKIKE
ncbi:hypothetical protein [Psychroserpens sp. Hel_I_66]|uniref:hypothetical protein n=1 Tax=Psychroserpens sp. Hel_I_66 TaxID=1250004 RepID=UPI00068A9D3F|nr:hypothetical protein [Psychroserpens sp. Hel_I_66]